MDKITKTQLIDILSENKLISTKDIEAAITFSNEHNIGLFESILEKNIINEETLLKCVSSSVNISYEKIDRATVDFKVSKMIPEAFAREHNILPLFQIGNILTVAISNPFDLFALEVIEMTSDITLNPILTLKDNIGSLFSYCYSFVERGGEEGSSVMANLYEMGMKLVGETEGSEDATMDLAQEAPIAKLVDTILKQAVEENASDIHIEPEESTVKIRFRVDGLLRDIMSPPKKLELPIISRLKILSNMDITEKRKPQDGRMTLTLKEKDIDFRVSTVATIDGEKMVLRVLDKSGSTFVSLDKIGLSEQNISLFQNLIASTSGILIVCGPTGSGKTTTLYSALAKINTPDLNIITIEDPVEYNLEGINQIPVNAKIGVDFVHGLSSIVRQDPDVIMVGEVRDTETAQVAIQAALTGHMVYTTLHTRSAPAAITRLTNMGIPPYLITSSVIGVVGQRLMRTICANCKEKKDYSKEVLNFKQTAFFKEIQNHTKKNVTLFKGSGCKFCDNSGYKGRIGIFEILTLNEEIRTLIINKSSSEQIHKAACDHGMVPLTEDAIQKVLEGDTTIEEVARVLDL